MLPPDGRVRVAIEGVRPEVDCGLFPSKRIVGDQVIVRADIFTDGHDAVAGEILYRHGREEAWQRSTMTPAGNDCWAGSFLALKIGCYFFTIQGWIDPFGTWQTAMLKRIESGQDLRLECLVGAGLIEEAASRAASENAAADATRLHGFAQVLYDWSGKPENLANQITGAVIALMQRYPDRRLSARYEKALRVVVDREKARCSAWYEMFPRSCASAPGRPGTLKDCAATLPYVAEMGFDVLYLPPIHPIGRTARKGKNNEITAAPDDVGSPWAIGSEKGGHDSIDPKLGTLNDLEHLVAQAQAHGIEIALDLAFQCSPDHPYVRQHPEWFRKRPDGTIQHAENPPKKYQDILPLDFETSHWQELWEELKRVVLFWIGHGVRIFRVDNPHTKALPFGSG